MKIKTTMFNTKRFYAKEGQRIFALQKNFGCVWMYDYDRGIMYAFALDTLNEKTIMHAYDHNLQLTDSVFDTEFKSVWEMLRNEPFEDSLARCPILDPDQPGKLVYPEGMFEDPVLTEDQIKLRKRLYAKKIQDAAHSLAQAHEFLKEAKDLGNSIDLPNYPLSEVTSQVEQILTGKFSMPRLLQEA